MKILISAGPTREKIDPIRFISNRSTGKMGYALAEAALLLGNEVTLVSGPVEITPPVGVTTIKVESAQEMYDAMIEHAPNADIIIMSAAVADYRPVTIANSKVKKHSGNWVLELERTQDILSSLGKKKGENQILVGFAAESENLEEYALDKLQRKNLDWIIANRIEDGFGKESNRVLIFNRFKNRFEFPTLPKKELAMEILKIVIP